MSRERKGENETGSLGTGSLENAVGPVRNGMNPKTLQYLMGHSDISVIMNTYTHLGLEDAAAEMKQLEDVERARMEQEKILDSRHDLPL